MSDTPETRAARVESVLETGNLTEAMNSLNQEMSSVSGPEQRRQLLNALQRRNDEANRRDWSLPNVEITYSNDGNADVNFSQNILERLAFNPTPYGSTTRALEKK